MVDWKYNPEDYGKTRLVEPGKYRVRIEEAEEQTSKSGKQMIVMKLKVSGYGNFKIWHYIVFLPDMPEITNRNLGEIFDSFNIEQGDFNLYNWKGKVGAAEIDNESDQNGNLRSRVKHFVKREDQDTLPAWQEKTVQGTINPEMVNFSKPPF